MPSSCALFKRLVIPLLSVANCSSSSNVGKLNIGIVLSNNALSMIEGGKLIGTVFHLKSDSDAV